MRVFGVLLLVVGLIALFAGFGMDTTVPTRDGGRVNNIGLISDKQNIMLLGAALSVVGAILTVFGGRSSREGVVAESSNLSANTRKCPFCAETIKAEAVVCRFCSRDIAPVQAIADSLTTLSHDELMAKYGISNDGVHYHFQGFRYDKLEDAVAYAQQRASGA